jgi:hypothetical protein
MPVRNDSTLAKITSLQVFVVLSTATGVLVHIVVEKSWQLVLLHKMDRTTGLLPLWAPASNAVQRPLPP